MKKFKRILSIVLAMTMVLAMGVTAFAAEDTHKLTLNEAPNGHEYSIYQIFTGDLSGEAPAYVLSNVKWGNGVTKVGETAVTAGADATAAAESLKGKTLEQMQDYVDTLTLGTAFATKTAADGKVEFDNLPNGYYLVKDTTANITDGYSRTAYVLQVVGDTTGKVKAGKTTSDKNTKDINDSLETTLSNWKKSADHDVNDTVPYELKATLDQNLANYKKYYLAFHDDMSKGLTFDQSSVVVKLNGNTIDNPFTITSENSTKYEGGKIYHFTCDDIKTAITGIKGGDVITIEYNATLNDDAVIGVAGNPNTLTVEYSRNPNEEGEGKPETDTTPEKTCIVFTYKVVVDKVQPDGEGTKSLEGANFLLEKLNAETGAYEKVDEITLTNVSTFSFNRLDDGKYKLTETKTPAGFNTIDPIFFEIEAVHTDDETTGGQLTSLVVKDAEGNTISGEGLAFDVTLADGQVHTDVLNQQGSELPSTGGMGTTIFYIVGAMLAVGAAVILVTKKRMNG